jgi:methionyl aminopeptidase
MKKLKKHYKSLMSKIIIKTQEEIDILREGGHILGEIMDQLIAHVQPGISTKELDEYAYDLMIKAGGEPAIKGYCPGFGHEPYPATLCTSVNEEIVHGVPSGDMILEEGDIIGIDTVFKYKGMYTDIARTVPVGEISKEARELLVTTQQALDVAVQKIKEGESLYVIGEAIEDFVDGRYGIVRDLVGHGVGREIHEEPNVTNYRFAPMKKHTMKKGMVIAVEPMLTTGEEHIQLGEDNWVYHTTDQSLAAQFEYTVAINHDGSVEVLTPTQWRMT